ncbi:peptide ABC transporter substrate-binding protein [Desulforudis sp. 1088]|uniref:peptide ABC transporter substrate-binding protein n=1 Tax=unclassified Candidatus Desulforudis TaxID=2635950 RepID=UPI003CE5BA7E
MPKQLRFLLIVLVVVLAGLLAAGCGGGKDGKDAGKQAAEQYIRYNLGAEPETLDPARSTGLPEGTLITHLLEGLTRYDANNVPQPAIAESWDISPDQLTYTFHLRDAKWSNGEPVTAEDFKYAWLRALNPETAADYAYQLFYIKGAAEYNSGEGKAEDVAIKVVDPKTLEVTLKAPAPQFLGLTAFPTLFPINAKMDKENPEWYKSPETYICNGPFKMVSWEHNQKITTVKNENYWDAANVKLQKLDFLLVESYDTAYNMYRTGEVDILVEDIPTQEIPQLKASGELKIFPDCALYFYRFNVEKKPLNDVRVRKALAMAIDRQAIVENVTQAGQKPAFGFVPYGIADADGKDFQENSGNAFFKEDVAEAKKLLAEAGFPEGKGFPKLKLLYNTNEAHQKIAQAIQQMWKQNLGIDIELVNQEWQVYLDSMDHQNFDICRSGWSPDYLDPMTFIDMFVTEPPENNNDTNWSNKKYDELVKKANATGDQKERMAAMHEAEKILMDEMPIMPIYYYTKPCLIKDNIKGVIIPPFAVYADFKYAYVE